MYYASRFAPEKPGMPLLGYFAGVGSVLLGLLFVADAYMPRTGHLSFVSNVDGLPTAYKGKPARLPPATPHTAPAVAETTGSSFGSSGSALAAEAPKTLPVAAAPLPHAHKAAKPTKRKMVARRQPHRQDPISLFGQQGLARQDHGRQDFGFRSREPFGSREPSWRDSWASADPRARRNAWRSGDGFGYFR